MSSHFKNHIKMKLIEHLNWRYAAKKFKDQKVSEEDMNAILEAMRLTASSGGLQPYRLFVIDNKDIRQKLAVDSFNHQITDASHLIGIAVYTHLDPQDITNYISQMAAIRQVPVESLDKLKKALESFYLNMSDEEIFQWASKQAYIALGTGLIAAAELKVDSTPMEGFDAERLDKLLKLEHRNLKSVVLLALGYRDEDKDYLANAGKVRLSQADFIEHV